MKSADQSFIESTLPRDSFLSAKQVAAACGQSPRTVLYAFDQGKIMGFEINARAPKDAERRFSKRIPREFAALYIASLANFDDVLIVENICKVISKLPRPLATKVRKAVDERLAQAW